MKSLLRISLLAGAAVAAASPSLADVKAGVDAWSRGDYARAVNEWKAPADRGDADAMFNLGQAYKLGRGVPVDLTRAEDLFGKAAAKGHLQAADNYGLLLFQRGEHARALPYVKAASDRGDPRSQYLLGIAHFNGDNVGKDWVRAYALVSLAQQAGLPQAGPALAQMDNYIPIEQRQQSVSLASQLAGAAQATRERQLAAVDLGSVVPTANSVPAAVASAAVPRVAQALPAARTAQAVAADAVDTAKRMDTASGPDTAGADYARPEVVTLPRSGNRPRVAVAPTPPPSPRIAPPPRQAPAAATEPKPALAPAQPKPTPAPASAANGSWRVQLGAFGVPANAEALWNRVKSRPEIAGRTKLLVPVGKVAKLQAGGFASQSEAQAACSRLSAAGFTCLAVRN